MVEVAVSGAQHEVVLENQRRDPQVMDGNRLAPPAKVTEESSVVMGGLLVGEESGHAGLGQERAEDALVLGATLSQREAGPKLGDDDEGKEDSFGVADQLDDPGLAPA